MVLVTYDADAKAMYIDLDDKKHKAHRRVAKTIPLGEGRYLDVSEKNEPLGLEIILPGDIPQEAIDAIINRNNKTIEILQ